MANLLWFHKKKKMISERVTKMRSLSGKNCVNLEKSGKMCYSNCEMVVGKRTKGGQSNEEENIC